MNTLLKTVLVMTAFAVSPVLGQKDNPLLGEWKTPHQTPPFAEIKTEHYRPAVEKGMDEARKNIDAITSSKEKPTFLSCAVNFSIFLSVSTRGWVSIK